MTNLREGRDNMRRIFKPAGIIDTNKLPVPEQRQCCRIEHDDSPVNCVGEPLSPLWWRGRQWAVTEYGIERLDGEYTVDVDSLSDVHMLDHVARKLWTDTEDWATAWLVAMTMHGVQIEPDKLREIITLLPLASPAYCPVPPDAA